MRQVGTILGGNKMDKNITSMVEGVLDKYSKHYSREVDYNLKMWKENKAQLVDLLRKHPNWNEDEMAVVFDIEENRGIDRAKVVNFKNEVADLCWSIEMSNENRNNYTHMLSRVCETFGKSIASDETVRIVKDGGLDCVVGKKTSRVINDICKKYGVDRHPEYNAKYAKLADSLNPLQVKRTAILSVHPCDYLEMSNKNNSWSSCHTLRDGSYQAGTLSYMNDAVSMIFYTVDDFERAPFYSAPKRTRQVFCYGKGILLQSRLYPDTGDDETRDIYRNIVQRAIADCLGVQSKWVLRKKQEEVFNLVSTHDHALHYTDYTHKEFKANVSMLKSVYDDDTFITVGSTGFCIECSEEISNNDTLYCKDCDDGEYHSCAECGNRVHEDEAYEIDDQWYCSDCTSYCERCEGRFFGEVYDVHDGNGERICVCEECLDNYQRCERCDDYFHVSNVTEVDGDYYCDICLTDNFTECHSCDDYTRNDHIAEIDGEYYCESCAEDILSEMND
jgi:hypothetical protein